MVENCTGCNAPIKFGVTKCPPCGRDYLSRAHLTTLQDFGPGDYGGDPVVVTAYPAGSYGAEVDRLQGRVDGLKAQLGGAFLSAFG